MFKICKTCKTEWDCRNSFLMDSNIELVGYQVEFEELTLGLLLFNHTCGTTLSIYAKEFTDLYNGPVFEYRAVGGVDCPGYCLRPDSIEPCPVQCECAYIREVLQLIAVYKKDDMTIIDWGSNYFVGVKEIDEQHKKLVEMTRNLAFNIENLSQVEINTLLEELIHYTVFHFDTEEKIYLTDHVDFASHKNEHSIFIEKVSNLHHDIFNNKISVGKELLHFLLSWLRNHILDIDKVFFQNLHKQ